MIVCLCCPRSVRTIWLMIVLFVLSQICKNEMVDDCVFKLSQICTNDMVDDRAVCVVPAL